MTSSLRNSLHRRNHKERSQLAHRSRLGILEKHKDYVKRARDYHSKQDRLTRLKQKAAERNKDEFYFSMTREKTKGGLHMRDRGNVALPTDMVKILKSQDENYVRTMRAAGLKKIDKIKSQLMAIANLLKPGQGIEVDESDQLDEAELQVLTESGIISAKSQSAIRRRRPGHVVFVESEEQARQYTPSKYNPNSSQQMIEDQSPSDLGWKLNSPKPSKKRKSSSTSETDTSNEIVDNSSNRQRLLKELSARLIRDKQLRNTEREFEMQKLMMGKGARKKISGVQKVEGDRDDDEEDQDEIDARKGRPRPKRTINDETYKPRVYKWRLERKK